MMDAIVVQYVGFIVNGPVREYTFAVREMAAVPLHYTLSIANEAFVAHRVRYQDAPDICSLKLRRELDAHANHPPTTSFSVTDANSRSTKRRASRRRAGSAAVSARIHSLGSDSFTYIASIPTLN